jgi:hypothetical protein
VKILYLPLDVDLVAEILFLHVCTNITFCTGYVPHFLTRHEELVGCPCVAMAHNNTQVNYSLKWSQDFLLIVSALCIIFFLI